MTEPANQMIADALAKGEDTTGLGTVREAVAVMREFGIKEAEIFWIDSEGLQTNVMLTILRDDHQ